MSEEKKKILKMVEDGKISAEEAMDLLRAVDDDIATEEADAYETEADPTSTYEPQEALDETIERIKRYGNIPLWGGVILVVIGGLWMFGAMQASGFGFWFYCSWVPFFLGVLAVAAAAGSRRSRWVFVNIKQAPGETPQRIMFGLPLPLRFAAWAMRTFGNWVPDMDVDSAAVADMIEMLADSPSDEPAVIVDVHDAEDGEHVQVFIG
jgi:hypothetical protein